MGWTQGTGLFPFSFLSFFFLSFFSSTFTKTAPRNGEGIEAACEGSAGHPPPLPVCSATPRQRPWASAPSARPPPRQHLAAARTWAVLLRLSEPRRPHLRDGSDGHANGAGDNRSEAWRRREAASVWWRREGLACGGLRDLGREAARPSVKGREGHWPLWEERGSRDCPQGAWAPLGGESVGTGAPPRPPPSDPCAWWQLGKGQGTGIEATPGLTMHLRFFERQRLWVGTWCVSSAPWVGEADVC